MPKTPSLKDFRRIVVKVGSSLLVDAAAGALKRDWLGLARRRHRRLRKDRSATCWWSPPAPSRSAAPCSSCPRARSSSRRRRPPPRSGRSRWRAPGRNRWARTASPPARCWSRCSDTEERRRYLNARSTIAKLLEWRSVPVINENDTVATSEIRYGDNDRLAARVATMMSADLLVLLSDVDGLYDKPPGAGAAPSSCRWSRASRRRSRPWRAPPARRLARGGMVTKIEAGKIATTAGTHMVIASGHVQHPLQAIAEGAPCTWFLTPANPVTARKKWIAGSLEPRGALIDRCRRGARAAHRQEPAAGGRDQGRGRVRARRRRGGARAGRRTSSGAG